MSPAVETLGLAKRFGRTTALADFTLSVGRGEAFGLLGPNGAGKTTAVKLLLGLARPTSGAGRVLGAALGDREARRRVGYLPELFRYPPWLAANEVVAFHTRLLDMPRAAAAAAASDVLERVGLAARASERVGTFSKGMQQRLGLAVALVGEPELVILDEPTSALDPVGRHDVRAIIEDLRARGVAVVLNSHLLTEVERVCDRIAVVDRGTVVARGTIDEIRRGAAATVDERVRRRRSRARAPWPVNVRSAVVYRARRGARKRACRRRRSREQRRARVCGANVPRDARRTLSATARTSERRRC